MLLDLRADEDVGTVEVVYHGPATTGPHIGRPISRQRTIHSWRGKLRGEPDTLAATNTKVRVHAWAGQLLAQPDQLGAADTFRHPARYQDAGTFGQVPDSLTFVRGWQSGAPAIERQEEEDDLL